eukprot:4148279-Ditylum_brightwellii.AAC.2
MEIDVNFSFEGLMFQTMGVETKHGYKISLLKSVPIGNNISNPAQLVNMCCTQACSIFTAQLIRLRPF